MSRRFFGILRNGQTSCYRERLVFCWPDFCSLVSELLWHPRASQLTLCLWVGTERLGWDTSSIRCILPMVLGCGVRGHLEGLQAEKEAVAPSPCQVGEVWVGFGWGRGSGLPESVKKSLMLLSKGKRNCDARDFMGMRIATTAWAAGTDPLGRSLKSLWTPIDT